MKKIAEALVQCGYADRIDSGEVDGIKYTDVIKNGLYKNVDPFADTLEGRRQLEALEKAFVMRTYQERIKAVKDHLQILEES